MESEVMANTETTSLVSRTFHSVHFDEFRQSISSQVSMMSTLVDLLMRFVASFRRKDGSQAGIETALGEALANAVIHGHHKDASKRVQVTCLCNTNGEVWISVRDEGYGFDTYALPDPTTLENRLATHGRGMNLMRAFMDEVQCEKGGTVVRMHKNSNAAPPA
jgi:anti-sigma regulatory factor (Ser/Thr protein kinase)